MCMFRTQRARLHVPKNRPRTTYKVVGADGNGPYYKGFKRVRGAWIRARGVPTLTNWVGWYSFATRRTAQKYCEYLGSSCGPAVVVPVQIAGVVVSGLERGVRGFRSELIQRVR